MKVSNGGLTSPGLLSERQVIQPLLLALLISFACYLTFSRFYDGDTFGLLDRYLANGFCRLILGVFLAASLYAALHYLGLGIERYHLELLLDPAAATPPLYALSCFLSGRNVSQEDRFFAAAKRWYGRVQKSEEFAQLRDHLLLLREQQHQHNLAPLQFTVWVLPLLGFIGTVLGITQAIGGLQEAVATSGEAASGGLQTVLGGLSFAFDTTFMGLILVIPSMVYTLPLRTRAQKLDLCYQEILLDRLLRDEGTAKPALILNPEP